MDLDIFHVIDQNVTVQDSQVDNYVVTTSYILTTVPIILLLFGIPGNLLCIAVLSRRSMKDNVFSVYLVSLCIFNILTMCVNLPRFINYGEVGREFSFHNDYVCMLYRWLTITLIVITNWHLVIITAARLTFVLDRKRKIHVYRYYPLQYIFIICLVVIMVELPIVVFWVRIVTDKNGNVECYLPGTSWLVYVQMSLQGFLPAILLIGLNFWIFYQHKVRDTGMISSRHSSKMVRHLAVLSVLSSLQFVLTTIPMTILYPGRKRLFDLSTPVGQSKGNLAFSLALMSIHFNYSSNFLIYCFFGRRFRSEFFKLIQDSLRPLCILDFMDVMDYVSSSSASEVSKMKTEVSSSAASNAPDSYKSENDPAQLEPDRLRANSAGKKSTSSERTYQSARGDTSASIAVTEASIYADVITYFSDGSQKSVEEDHEVDQSQI